MTKQLFGWGSGERNALAELGTGNIALPTTIGIDLWASIAATGDFGVNHAIKPDGTLWAWGNGFAYTGLGDTANTAAPTQVGTSTWKMVAATAGGGIHHLAIQSDDSLWAWGNGVFGRLGLGSTTTFTAPQKVGAASWRTVSAAVLHTMGVQTDGTLWGWGDGSEGQRGTGATTQLNSPGQVGVDTDWVFTSCGSQFSHAIKADGTLWGSGKNTSGQIGRGNTSVTNTLVQIGTSTWTMVSGGFDHALGIRTGGTLWAWGSNVGGQLGLSDNIQRTSPVQIGTDTWLTVWAGNNRSFGIKTNGTLWAWGNNGLGRLGLGDSTNRTSPVQVGSDSTWSDVTGGAIHTLALAVAPPLPPARTFAATGVEFITSFPSPTTLFTTQGFLPAQLGAPSGYQLWRAATTGSVTRFSPAYFAFAQASTVSGFRPGNLGTPFGLQFTTSSVNQFCQAFGFTGSLVPPPTSGSLQTRGATGFAVAQLPVPNAVRQQDVSAFAPTIFGLPSVNFVTYAISLDAAQIGAPLLQLTQPMTAPVRQAQFGTPLSSRSRTYFTYGIYRGGRVGRPVGSNRINRAATGFCSVISGTPVGSSRNRTAHLAPGTYFGQALLRRASTC